MEANIKYTEIGLYPMNKEPIVEHGFIEGTENTLRGIFEPHLKALERKKLSYIFKCEKDGLITYRFSLTKIEFEQYKKYIPEIINN